MEQLPSETNLKRDDANMVEVADIPKDNSEYTNPPTSELSVTADPAADVKCKDNFQIPDQKPTPTNAEDDKKGHPLLLRNNSQGSSKLASSTLIKSQTKTESENTQLLADASSIESDKPTALSPVKTNIIPKEGSKPSLLPTPRKNISPFGASLKLSNSSEKSETTEKTSTARTASVNSRIPPVKKHLSTLSLISNTKTAHGPTTEIQQKKPPRAQRSPSKLSLNKPQFNQYGANKTNPTTFTSASNVSKIKSETKTQSARSSSSNAARVNTRSASVASSRSMPASKKEVSQTNLRKMVSTAGDSNLIESLEKKLEKAQTEFLCKIEKLKLNSPERGKSEYNLVTVTRNNERKLVIKDAELLELTKKMPANKISDFKEIIKKFQDDFFDAFIDSIKASDEFASLNIEEYDFEEKLKPILISKSNDIFSHIDEFFSSYESNSDSQIVKMQTELLKFNKALKESENNITELTNQYEVQLFKQRKHFEDESKKLYNEIISLNRENQTVKTALQDTEQQNQTEIKNLEEQLKSSKGSFTSLTKKFQAKEQQLTQERNELKTKNEVITSLEKKILEMDNLKYSLTEMTKNMEELKAQPKAPKACPEHVQQIAELKMKVDKLENDKMTLKQKIEKLEADSSTITELSNKLKATECQVKNLEKQLQEKNKLAEKIPACDKNLKIELSKIRQSEEEKRREIEKLKTMLARYELNMSQLEERLQSEQRLLQVRSELINSLQSNETSQRNQMEELFAQIGEKNIIINELQNELQTKSEEFKNLFNSIGTKQMELSNQEHIIKLLEESNERSQMLRVKQEEKISRMEEELTHLKQTISIYQANILSGPNYKSLLFTSMLPPSNMDCYENYYYFSSERKRKRQNDIVVKKYEV